MKRTCEFCGVRTSSFGLVMGDPSRLMALDSGAAVALKCALKARLNISPRWGTRHVDFGGGRGRAATGKAELLHGSRFQPARAISRAADPAALQMEMAHPG